MSRGRTIIISLGVLAVLGIVVAALLLTSGDEVSATPTPPPIVSDDDIANPLELSYSDVKSVSFSGSGPAYTITRDPSDGTLSVTASRSLFPFKSDEVSYLFTLAVRITELKRVAKDADDETIAEFGLKDPLISWRITLFDGKTVDVALSDKLLARYIYVVGESDIYILDDYSADKLSCSIEDLYDYSFLPEYIDVATDEDTTWGWFTRMAVTTSERTIEVRRRGEAFSTGYQMYLPVEANLNEKTVVNSFLVPITTIKPTEMVEKNPSDLSKYGLDTPIRLELTDETGWSGALLVGNKTETGRYVMIEGINAVLLDTTGDYVFTETPYYRLRLGLVWLHVIDTVKSVDYYLGNTARHLELEHINDKELKGWLDDKELSDPDARAIYSSALSLACDGETTEEIPNGPPDYKFVITLLNGEQQTLELYELNERQYLMVLDGENLSLIIFKTTLTNNLLSKFDMLDQDIEIS